MSDKRKTIPIVSANAVQEDTAINSCAEAEPFALRVIGDSMAPEFLEGHIIIVDPALPPQHGSYVIIDYGGETTFRQFWVENGRKYLKALSNDYPTIEMEENYSVRGVVVQRAGRRRQDHKHYH